VHKYRTRRGPAWWFLSLAAAIIIGVGAGGCGSSSPPPDTTAVERALEQQVRSAELRAKECDTTIRWWRWATLGTSTGCLFLGLLIGLARPAREPPPP